MDSWQNNTHDFDHLGWGLCTEEEEEEKKTNQSAGMSSPTFCLRVLIYFRSST